MVFFFPVMGSKRATALASGVRLYRAMRSCEAEGFEGRCSGVRIGKSGWGGGQVRCVFRQYIRRFGVDGGGGGGGAAGCERGESGVSVMAEEMLFVWWWAGEEAVVDCVEMLFWMSF